MILLQINFNYPMEKMGDALTKDAKDLANSINNEPGFISKIWIENADTKESGGIHVFQDMDKAMNYGKMHTERVEAMGATNIVVKYFNINEPLSKINKGI